MKSNIIFIVGTISVAAIAYMHIVQSIMAIGTAVLNNLLTR